MLRTWQLNLDLSKVPGLALYLQIAQKIIDEIQRGRLAPATAMPSTRELAERLQVNRKTAMLTYDELIAQGWLVTENRRGTFVSTKPPYQLTPMAKTKALADLEALAFQADDALNTESRNPAVHVVSFSEGKPDLRLIPYETYSRAFRRALVTSTRTNQEKSESPKGELALRKAIAHMLNMENGFRINTDNICMVRGSQMAIYLAARIIIRPGDGVIFEALTYPSARETFASVGASVLSAGIDEEGINVEEVERLCKQHSIRAVFLTPSHQFPTAVSLSVERRKKLLMLAEIYDFLIIEDGHDCEFNFSDKPTFPLISEDKQDRVIYIGSLSNVLSMALSVGYIIGSSAFTDQCAKEMMLIDHQDNSAIDLAVSELMHSGEIKRQMLKMAKIYKERRDYFQQLLEEELQPWVHFTVPQNGLAFWVSFRQNMDMKTLAIEAEKEKLNLAFGDYFSEKNTEVQGLRLGFACLNEKEMHDGIKRLKNVILKTVNNT